MRGRRILSIPVLLLALVVSLLSGPAPVHAAADDFDCGPTVHIIGVRGSGQSLNDPDDPANTHYFGKTLEPYRRIAGQVLYDYGYTHDRDIHWVPLAYPAVPAYSRPEVYEASVETGARMLADYISDLIHLCGHGHTPIGLMGYSQGAQVINRALPKLNFNNLEIDNVESILLLADPTSAGAGSPYARSAKTDGFAGEWQGQGIFGPQILPDAVWDDTTDFCIIGDPVCDAKQTITAWDVLGLLTSIPIHLMYDKCCGEVNDFVRNLGTEFVYRLIPGIDQGRPAPPEPVDPYVSTLAGLPDGQVLLAQDTGRVYKLVGGAPVWLSSCANNICAGIRPTSQAVIDTGPPAPRDGATAKDEAGNVFKFVGGAPIHLSSCSVGCGSPVAITAWSVVNFDHMRRTPADGATAKDESGNVFKFVGGAPIHLSSCSVGCGSPVPITGWSVATLEHMRAFPADGATAKDESGNVFKFVGGAPIHLSSCSVGCGSPVPITGWSVATLEHMRAVPADASTAVDEAGNIFKFAGGAPIHLASCAVGCGKPVPITGWSVATLEHMRPVPADGTVVVDEPGDVFVFAGGAPLHLSSCVFGCESMIRISGASITNLDHMRPFPTDNTTIRTESGAIYKFAGGAPLHLTTCDPGCGEPVGVTQWTVDNREHMNQNPANGTNIQAVESGTLFRTRGGEADLAGQCPAASGCSTSVVVNQASVDAIAHGVANRGPQYGLLTSYSNGTETRSSTGSVPAGYRLAATFGLLARTAEEGTLPFYSCQTGDDVFSSTSTTCEGRTVLARLGYIYASPPAGHPAVAVFRCKTAEGEHFDSANPTCGGVTVEGKLGYVLGYGKLTRYNAGGEHASATMTVPAGYQPEGTLGLLPVATTPGTVPVFACRAGTDLFTSTSTTCEGQTKVSQLGFIYTAPPADQPSVAVYRCNTTAGDHFDSLDAACEGRKVDGQLGYVLARKVLTRAVRGSDHRSGTGVFPPGYRHDGTLGILAGTNEAGTKPLYSCQSGGNAFTSLAADCEGREKLGQLGWIWGQPPAGVPSLPLYRCTVTGSGEHFDATDAACEGHTSQGLLGYLRVNL